MEEPFQPYSDTTQCFNGTSRCLNDIFIIDSREFEKHIPDIYQADLYLNTAYTSDKELIS